MGVRVFFIHTVTGLTGMFDELCEEIVPEAEPCHISDESMIKGILAAKGLTPAIYRRTCEHVVAAEAAGAQVVQLTCSSISPCADVARHMVGVSVLKIDEPMVRTAVQGYGSVGVIATNPGTLNPSTGLVKDVARELGKEVQVKSVLCEGAYPAWLSGDREEHDRIVRGFLLDLMESVEVVCLAQVSMARVVETLEDGQRTVPILSSPRPAVQRLAAVVAGLNPERCE
jgi:Asp/Glu/hydantoin racemase